MDNLAPGLLYDMHEDEVLGRWRLQGADCGRGLYEVRGMREGRPTQVRAWRLWLAEAGWRVE